MAQFGIQHVVPAGMDFPYAFLYLIAIFVVAWWAGYVPGAISCLLTAVGLPALTAHRFDLSAVDPSRVLLLLGVSLLISRVAATQRRSQKILREANSELDQRVQSRTQDLAHAVEILGSEVAQRTSTERRIAR